MENNLKTFTPLCKIYRKCNGCQLQNFSYSNQLKLKQNYINKIMKLFCKPEKIIGMLDPLHYRNKSQAFYRITKSGEYIACIYQTSKKGIVPAENCILTDKKSNEIFITLGELFKTYKIKPYFNGNGIIKSVTVKRGYKTDEIMLILNTVNDVGCFDSEFINALVNKHSEIAAVVEIFNSGAGTRVLFGNGKIKTKICDFIFDIYADSFYRINSLQTEILYSKAIEFAEIKPDDVVIDAYGGIGTIGIIVNKLFNCRVLSVNLNRASAEYTKIIADENLCKNIEFVDGGVGVFRFDSVNIKINTVFVDTLNCECDERLLRLLMRFSPEKIICVTCGSTALQKNMFFLCKNGYKVVKIQPVDTAPFKNCVETVVKLVK